MGRMKDFAIKQEEAERNVVDADRPHTIASVVIAGQRLWAYDPPIDSTQWMFTTDRSRATRLHPYWTNRFARAFGRASSFEWKNC